jgi:predicted type IV restriction endonuclease
MTELDLLQYRDSLRLRPAGERQEIWDPIRRKYVALTPEEMVRQLLIAHLIQEGKALRNRISVEKQIKVLGRQRRYDLVIHDRHGAPLALVECKRPEVPLDQTLLDQIGRYNLTLGVSWLIVTNGPRTVCLGLQPGLDRYEPVAELPDFGAE